MFKNKSKVLFVASLLGSLYVLVIFVYYGTGLYMAINNIKFPNPIVTIFVMPHLIIMAIGVLLNWFSFFKEKPWASFIGSLFYSIGGFSLFPFLIYTGPLIILSFNGYFNQVKIKEKVREKN